MLFAGLVWACAVGHYWAGGLIDEYCGARAPARSGRPAGLDPLSLKLIAFTLAILLIAFAGRVPMWRFHGH